MLALGVGFTRTTDVFHQFALAPNGIASFANGPFTTAATKALSDARAEDRPAYVEKYRRLSVTLGATVTVAMVALGGVFGGRLGLGVPGWLAGLLLGLCCGCQLIIGFAVAAITAAGAIARASVILLAGNLLFALGIGAMITTQVRPQLWQLPTIFLIANVVTAAVALWFTRPDRSTSHTHVAQLPGLWRGFWLAGSETVGFLITQAVVVAIATQAGIGWLSAVMFVQRLGGALTGIVMAPLSSAVMLRVLKRDEDAAGLVARSTLGAIGVLSTFSVVALLAKPMLLDLLSSTRLLTGDETQKLGELVLPAAIWLVALGANFILARGMFAMNLGRTYVSITLLGYAAANSLRLLLGWRGDVRAALLAGACCEALAVGALIYATWHRRGRDRL